MSGIRPSYLGLFEDNDPARRLLAIANFDNDVPAYWEWSGQGLFPFANTNDACKLGMNCLVYGLTHCRRAARRELRQNRPTPVAGPTPARHLRSPK